MRLFATLFFFHIMLFSQNINPSVELNTQLKFYNEFGEEILNPLSGGYQAVFLQVLDLDHNGKKEILLTSQDIGLLQVFEQKKINSFLFEKKLSFVYLKKISRWFYFVDLNKDNIFDLLSLDDFDVMGYQLNTGTNLSPELSSFNRIKDQNNQFIIPEFGNIPVIYDIDKDGNMDIFISTQTQGNIIYYKNISTQSVSFQLVTEKFGNISVLGRAKKHGRSSFAFVDLDKDNDTDLIWGDQFQTYFYYVENKTNDINPSYSYDQNFSFTGGGSFTSNYTYNLPIFTDLNSDNQYELILLPQTDPNNNIQLYTHIKDTFNFQKITNSLIPTIDVGYSSAVKFFDLNNDNRNDLIISTSADTTNAFNLNFYHKTDLGFKKVNYQTLSTLPWTIDHITGNDFQIIDLNKDNSWDIIFVDDNGVLYKSLNEGSNLSPIFNTYETIINQLGNFAQIRIKDLDNDGDFDMIVTQVLGNFYYYSSVNGLFDKKEILSFLSNQYDHQVTFDFENDSTLLVFDARDGTIARAQYPFNLNIETISKENANILYAGSNSNLSIIYNKNNQYNYVFATKNGGLIIYNVNEEYSHVHSKNLDIYPNPASNFINLKLPFDGKKIKVDIYNLLGKRVYHDNIYLNSNSIQIGLKSLTSGIYFIIIQNDQKILRSRFVFINN